MNNFQNNLDASVDRLMNASYALGVNANAAGYQAGLASAEIERLNREIRIQNMIKAGELVPDDVNQVMSVERQTVCNGVIKVQYLVRGNSGKEDFIFCVLVTPITQKQVLISRKALFTSKVVDELARSGVDLSVDFVSKYSTRVAVSLISKYVRDCAETVETIPYKAGYDELNRTFFYCLLQTSIELGCWKEEIPFLEKTLHEGTFVPNDIEAVQKLFSSLGNVVNSGFLFLMHQPFLVKWISDTIYKVGLNSGKSSKSILQILIPWDGKKYIASFKKGGFHSRYMFANCENLGVLIEAPSSYERKLLMEKIPMMEKPGVNVVVINDDIFGTSDIVDKLVYVPQDADIAQLPQGYYKAFVDWMNVSGTYIEQVISGLEFTKNTADIERDVTLVVNVIGNFWRTLGWEWDSDYLQDFIEGAIRFFGSENEVECNYVDQFVSLFKNYNFRLVRIERQTPVSGLGDNVVCLDDEFVYMAYNDFVTMAREVCLGISISHFCELLVEAGILVREHRTDIGYYNTVKAPMQGRPRMVKLRRYLLLSVADEIFWRDESDE